MDSGQGRSQRGARGARPPPPKKSFGPPTGPGPVYSSFREENNENWYSVHSTCTLQCTVVHYCTSSHYYTACTRTTYM